MIHGMVCKCSPGLADVNEEWRQNGEKSHAQHDGEGLRVLVPGIVDPLVTQSGGSVVQSDHPSYKDKVNILEL